MKVIRHFGVGMLGLALLAAVAAARPAVAASRLGLDLYGLSYHFDRRDVDGYKFNETNLGGGLDWVFRRGTDNTFFADAGLFSDSYRRTSGCGSVAWTHKLIGPLQGGLGLAIVSTPSVNNGELFMAPAPLLSLRTDRVAIHLAYVPDESGVNTYPGLVTWASLYPFGPVRVERADPAAPRDSSLATGLEFTVGSNFVLNAPDGAALAIKRRHGVRGWRVAADMSGYIDYSSRTLWTEDDLETSTDRSSGVFRFEGRAQRLCYYTASRGPELFLGYGPLLGYDNLGRTWKAGLVGSCGVEWRLAEIVSLGAEYGLDFVYSDRRLETESGEYSQTLREWSLDLQPRTVRLALTAWFD